MIAYNFNWLLCCFIFGEALKNSRDRYLSQPDVPGTDSTLRLLLALGQMSGPLLTNNPLSMALPRILASFFGKLKHESQSPFPKFLNNVPVPHFHLQKAISLPTSHLCHNPKVCYCQREGADRQGTSQCPLSQLTKWTVPVSLAMQESD